MHVPVECLVMMGSDKLYHFLRGYDVDLPSSDISKYSLSELSQQIDNSIFENILNIKQ